jgi:hypothetical protein
MTELNKHLGTMHKTYTVTQLPSVESIKTSGLDTSYLRALLDSKARFNGDTEVWCFENDCNHNPGELRSQARELNSRAQRMEDAQRRTFKLRMSIKGDY